MEHIRKQFPALAPGVNDLKLAYLDNAASTQLPESVLEAVDNYYRSGHANIDRGIHFLGQRATRYYDEAREWIAEFLGAGSAHEIIFVRGTTEAANLVSQAYVERVLESGDHVVVTEMEHHSNFIPWQRACDRIGAVLDVVRVTEDGALDLAHAHKLLAAPQCKFLAVTHASNVIGTITPIEELVSKARSHGIRVFVDGAQAVPHFPVNVSTLGCDFYAFSGHKAHAPTGIGVLFVRRDLLADMQPWQTGGGMVLTFSDGSPVFKDPPSRFEAGTPNISGAIGLSAAIAFLQNCFDEGLQDYENDLLQYLDQGLQSVERVRRLAHVDPRVGVVSFVYEGVHAHDVGSILDSEGVAVRVGHHCAIPLLKRFGESAVVRASLACYNTRSDIDALIDGLDSVNEIFPQP